MTRSETLLHPEEKPQEEKNTRRCSSCSEGSAPTGWLPALQVLCVKGKQEVSLGGDFLSPQSPAPQEEESHLLRESRVWALATLVIRVLIPGLRPLATPLRGRWPRYVDRAGVQGQSSSPPSPEWLFTTGFSVPEGPKLWLLRVELSHQGDRTDLAAKPMRPWQRACSGVRGSEKQLPLPSEERASRLQFWVGPPVLGGPPGWAPPPRFHSRELWVSPGGPGAGSPALPPPRSALSALLPPEPGPLCSPQKATFQGSGAAPG